MALETHTSTTTTTTAHTNQSNNTENKAQNTNHNNITQHDMNHNNITQDRTNNNNITHNKTNLEHNSTEKINIEHNKITQNKTENKNIQETENKNNITQKQSTAEQKQENITTQRDKTKITNTKQKPNNSNNPATEIFSEPAETAIKIFQERDVQKVRRACKILRGAGQSDLQHACAIMKAWLEEGVSPEAFPEIVRPFFNLMVLTGNERNLPLMKFLHDPRLCDNPECNRLLKLFLLG